MSKLSSSFSAHEFKNISSYRQQRMRSKPRLNTQELPEQLSSTARKDLQNIQETLKQNLSRRRSSQGCIPPNDFNMSRLPAEPSESPIVSDYLAEGRHHHKYPHDISLNIIEQNPSKPIKKDTTLKTRINLTTKNACGGTSKVVKNESVLQDMNSKQTPTMKANCIKRPTLKYMTNSRQEMGRGAGVCHQYAGSRMELTRLQRKVSELKDELQKAPLKRWSEILSHMDKIQQYLRQE